MEQVKDEVHSWKDPVETEATGNKEREKYESFQFL